MKVGTGEEAVVVDDSGDETARRRNHRRQLTQIQRRRLSVPRSCFTHRRYK